MLQQKIIFVDPYLRPSFPLKLDTRYWGVKKSPLLAGVGFFLKRTLFLFELSRFYISISLNSRLIL